MTGVNATSSVTKGQWFPLNVTNLKYQAADFDLQSASDLVVNLVSSLGSKYSLSYNITAYNELSAVCDGSIPAGSYFLEITCTLESKSYRMRSPSAVVKITTATTPSTAQKTVVSGDDWELTADCEMKEGAAESYMALLEKTRKACADATTAANNAASQVGDAVAAATQAKALADEATESASAAASAANTAKTNVESAEKSVENAEAKRVTAEQGRKDAESERVTAEQGRKDAESERVTAEQGRKDAESERVTAEQKRETMVEGYMVVIKKPIVSTSDTTLGMDANKLYAITVGAALTLNINAATDTSITNDWEGCFDTGATVPTVTWPADVNWGTSNMTLAANTHYEFSIRQSGGKYYGILYGWSLS